jgi:hypothetical protein
MAEFHGLPPVWPENLLRTIPVLRLAAGFLSFYFFIPYSIFYVCRALFVTAG